MPRMAAACFSLTFVGWLVWFIKLRQPVTGIVQRH
jgi:hypothetical protein